MPEGDRPGGLSYELHRYLPREPSIDERHIAGGHKQPGNPPRQAYFEAILGRGRIEDREARIHFGNRRRHIRKHPRGRAGQHAVDECGGCEEEPEIVAWPASGQSRRGGLGEPRPVRAELELHGDAGHHADGEVDGENLGPEAGALAVTFLAGAQSHGLQDDDQQRQPHGELRKDVVKRHRESEVQAVGR
jgi:hypothetical protein